VLARRGGQPVGRVVGLNDEEPGTLDDETAVDRGEAVLETDHVPERDAVESQRVDPLPRRLIVWDLLQRRDPRELVAKRHVLAEGDEMHLAVLPDEAPIPVEQQTLVVEGLIGRLHHRPGQCRNAHVPDRPRYLSTDCARPRVERALAPHREVRRIGGEPEV
jgi:hypothetical protein